MVHFGAILTIVGGVGGFLVGFLWGYFYQPNSTKITPSDNCRGNRWGFYAVFASLLHQNHTQNANRGEGGLFYRTKSHTSSF